MKSALVWVLLLQIFAKGYADDPHPYLIYKTQVSGQTIYRYEQYPDPSPGYWNKITGDNIQSGELSYIKAYRLEYDTVWSGWGVKGVTKHLERGGFQEEIKVCDVTYSIGGAVVHANVLTWDESCDDFSDKYRGDSRHGVVSVHQKFTFWLAEKHRDHENTQSLYIALCESRESHRMLYSTITTGRSNACAGGRKKWGDTFHGFRGNVFCPTLPDVSEGQSIASQNWDDGIRQSSVIANCDGGYVYDDGSSSIELTCGFLGRWNTDLPICRRIECGEPDEIEHGQIEGDSFYFEDTVTVSCDEGYKLPNSYYSTIQCMETGEWSVSNLACEPRSCGYPGDVVNGQIQGDVYTYGESVTFECDSNYRREGAEDATCQANGRWSNPNPRCVRITCPEVGHPDHGQRSGDQFYIGATVVFTCHEGYTLTGGEQALTCLPDGDQGMWSGDVPTCEVVDCEQPEVENGGVVGNQFTYGKTVRFVCDDGFRLRGATSATCRAEGWDVEPPVCQGIKCRNPQTPENGARTQEGSAEYINVGDHIVFTCNEGYVMQGDATMICTSDSNQMGKWQPPRPPTCNPTQCPELNSLEHGSRNTDVFEYGETAEFQCHPGYYLEGEAETTCLASGRWSNPLPTCKACPIGEYKPDTDLGPCVPCPEGSSTMTTASPSINHCICGEGFTRTDTGHCQAVECSPLAVPENGYQVDDCATDSGAECEFACNPGFIIQGSQIRRCGAKGWSGTSPVCTACPRNMFKSSATTCMPCPRRTHTTGSAPADSAAECICKPGFELRAGQCEDINECTPEHNNGNCSHDCYDTTGSYYCDCNIPGWSLDVDGKTCIQRKNCSEIPGPEHGELNCHHNEDDNAMICFINCEDGYFMVSGENDYVTCDEGTEFQWSHRRMNSSARVPDCTREFYVDTALPLEMKFDSDDLCNGAMLKMESLKIHVAEFILNAPQCNNRCEVSKVTAECVDNADGTSTTTISLETKIKNLEEGMVSFQCDSRCKRLNLREMVRATGNMMKFVKSSVENSDISSDELGFPVDPGSFSFGQLKTLCQEEGHVLTKGRLCAPCDKGYFLPSPDHTYCEPCPIGTFQPEYGSTECIPCFAGSTTLQEASDHPVQCSVRIEIGGTKDVERRDVLGLDDLENDPTLTPAQRRRLRLLLQEEELSDPDEEISLFF